MKKTLAALLALAALSFCHADSAKAAAFNACSAWGTPDDDQAGFGVMVCMGTVAPPSGTCPMGSVFPDGCGAAPAPKTARWWQPNAYQAGGYFHTNSATTADYTLSNCGDSGAGPCNPTVLWNQAGVTYAIGDYGTLIDPVATPPTGCNAPAANNTGGLSMTCGGTSGGGGFTGNLAGIEFGPVNGHECVGLNFIATTGVTAIHFTRSHFFNSDGKCSGTGQNGGSTSWMNVASTAYPGGIFIDSVYADGNMSVWDTVFGGCASGTSCNPCQFLTAGALVPVFMTYSVVRNFCGRTFPAPIAADIIMSWSWLEGWNNRPGNGHAEVLNASPPSGEIDINYSVVDQPIHISNFGPSPWFFANTYPGSITGMKIIGTTWINPFVGGGNTPHVFVSGCFGAPPTGGTAVSPTCGTGTDSTFYMTCLQSGPTSGCGTGNFGDGYGGTVGGNGGCTSIGGNGTTSGELYKPIPPPYPVTTPAVVGHWGADGFASSLYYPNDAINARCPAVMVSMGIANTAIAGDAHAVPNMGPVIVKNNFFDVSSEEGQPTPNIWTIGEERAAQTGWTGHITANILTVDTGTITTPGHAFIAGAGIDGCASGGAMGPGCPFIASGTAPTFTLSASNASPVSTEAMEAHYPSICSVPAAFSNNFDMTNTISPTFYERWTNSPSPDSFGC